MRAVIFDMDGVLVDSESVYLKIERRMFEERGMAVALGDHLGYTGMPIRDMWAELRARHGLSESVEALSDAERRAQLDEFEHCASIDPIPGVRELLAGLQAAGFALALASSSARRVVDTILAGTGLGQFFAATVCGEEVRRGKPAPDIFLEAARQLDVPPAACVVIEDSPHGIIAAQAAGMRPVGFRNPSVPGLDLSRADLVLPDYAAEHRRGLLAWLADKKQLV